MTVMEATRKRTSWTQRALIAEISSQDARRRPQPRGACEATHAALNQVDPSELLAAFLLAEIVQNPLREHGRPLARRGKRPRHERLPELHEDLASQDSVRSATPRIATSHPTLDQSCLPALGHLAGHVPDVQKALGLHVSLMHFCTVACASFSHLLLVMRKSRSKRWRHSWGPGTQTWSGQLLWRREKARQQTWRECSDLQEQIARRTRLQAGLEDWTSPRSGPHHPRSAGASVHVDMESTSCESEGCQRSSGCCSSRAALWP